VRSRLLFAAIIVAVNVGGILPGATQQLPSGGGPMPELRRGANGELEVVPAPRDSVPAPTRPKTSPAGPSTAGSPLPRVVDTVGGHYQSLKVGPNQTYKAPSAAAAVAKNGDRIEIEPGRYFDCAVWNADNLVIEGTGPGVVITDKTCMGKGLFVVEGNNTTVRNLTLTRARVPDMNGAGIRLDKGNLTVDKVKFIDNQNGIMGGAPGTTVTIRNSEFDKNGTCEGGCAHGIYIMNVDLLHVENSHFSNTRQAHSIKSRALRTEVTGCTITDGPEGTSSYLIEIPNGGALTVRDNTLEKGPKAENHTAAIAIGAEGVTHPTPEIMITNNNFRNDGDYDTALVWNGTATPAALKGNKLSGSVVPLKGDGTVQ
jgi:parallel beta helix pectate lyase-like protein